MFENNRIGSRVGQQGPQNGEMFKDDRVGNRVNCPKTAGSETGSEVGRT